MPWSNKQSKLAHIVQHNLGWDRAQYELVLRNVALVKPDRRGGTGHISGTNPSATNDGFERYMAFAEQCGYVDSHHGRGHWTAKARAQCPRVHRKIELLWQAGVVAHILHADGLPGYVERMTAKREEGPTRVLADAGPLESAQILEGLKAWLRREAFERRLNVDLRSI